MAIRIRKDGRIYCAALNDEEEGDIYIDDHIHYHLAVDAKVLVTTKNSIHMTTGGEWWWRDRVPEDIKIEDLF